MSALTILRVDPRAKTPPRLQAFDVGQISPVRFDWTLWLADQGAGLTVESSTWSTPALAAGVVVIGDGATSHLGVLLAADRIIAPANVKTEATLGFTIPGEFELKNEILFDSSTRRGVFSVVVPVERR